MSNKSRKEAIGKIGRILLSTDMLDIGLHYQVCNNILDALHWRPEPEGGGLRLSGEQIKSLYNKLGIDPATSDMLIGRDIADVAVDHLLRVQRERVKGLQLTSEELLTKEDVDACYKAWAKSYNLTMFQLIAQKAVDNYKVHLAPLMGKEEAQDAK